MMFTRILGLSFCFYLTIAIQGQSPATKQQSPATPPKTQSQPQSKTPAPKFENPFDSLTEFSATMVGSLFGNIDEIPIYRSGNQMRFQSWNKIDYFVTNLSTRDTYVTLLKPKKRCVYHKALPLQTFPFKFFRPDYKYERTPMGEEVVDGHHCRVESVARTAPSGGTMKVRFWEADDLKGFPIKVEVDRPAGRIVTIAFKDVKLGPPDPALFKHDKNCNRTIVAPQHGAK